MITGSALPRILNCPSSVVLARAESYSQAAADGNDDHAELADQTMTGTLPPELARHVPPAPRVEVKLVYNTATREARIIGEAADRNYGAPGPFDIFLSVDVLGVDGDAVIVLDWKTGQADVEPAATNGQLWAGALAACRALNRDRAIIKIVYTNQGARCDQHEIDALELAEFAGRLERLHTTVAALRAAHKRGETLSTREGGWCKYCPAKPFCPAKNALVVQVATQGLAVIGDAELTPERARAGYEQLSRIEDLIRDARKRLEVYVDDNGPIDLGDGRFYGRYTRPGNERLSGDVAVVAIVDVVGESAREFETLAVERKVSKAGIDRAAKMLGCKRGTAPAIVKRIRELGGASHAADTLPIGVFSREEPAEKPAIDVEAVNKLLSEVG